MENVGQGQFGEGLAGHSEEVVYDFKFGEDNHADLTWASLIAVGKESACNAGDPGSIPGSGRFAGEGIGYPLQYTWSSLVAQLVKNLPVVQETWV